MPSHPDAPRYGDVYQWIDDRGKPGVYLMVVVDSPSKTSVVALSKGPYPAYLAGVLPAHHPRMRRVES
jgi:hypothetical protein